MLGHNMEDYSCALTVLWVFVHKLDYIGSSRDPFGVHSDADTKKEKKKKKKRLLLFDDHVQSRDNIGWIFVLSGSGSPSRDTVITYGMRITITTF